MGRSAGVLSELQIHHPHVEEMQDIRGGEVGNVSRWFPL